MSIEKITINGKDYTIGEARELYNELHMLFGKTSLPLRPIDPIYPSDSWPEGWDRYFDKVTCSDQNRPKSFNDMPIGGGSSN